MDWQEFNTLRLALGSTFWAVVCAWSVARGQAPERIAGVAHFLATLATPLVQYDVAANHVEFGVFAVDSVLLAVFVWMALKWDRWWLIWATAFLVCQALTHVARLFNPEIHQFWYATAAVLWSFMSLWAQAFGMGRLELSRLARRRAQAALAA